MCAVRFFHSYFPVAAFLLSALLALEPRNVDSAPLFGTSAEVGQAGVISPSIFNSHPPQNSKVFSEAEDPEAQATARATVNADIFQLGVLAVDPLPDAFNPAGLARGAVGFSADSPIVGIEASAFVTGSFDNIAGQNLGVVVLNINQYDPLGGFPELPFQPFSPFTRQLGFLQIDTSSSPFNTIAQTCFAIRPYDCPPTFFQEFNWTGSHKLDFLIDTLSFRVLDVELYAFADTSGFPLDATTDFLSTMTLEIFPPPGVTVTLDSGQVFTGEVLDRSVPEPTTLALFGLALAGLGFSRRRQI